MTHSRPDVQRLLDDHGLRPSRALGQNFVVDPNTVRRIARLAGASAERPVIEIGAGLGSLTLALVEAGARVVAVEADRHLIPVLAEVVAGLPVRVVHADALHLDWDRLLVPASVPGTGTEESHVGAPPPTSWSLVANLPYNVATPVVITALERARAVGTLTVLVQREVAERMAATAGSPAYGAVSVKIAYWATAAVVGKVPPSVFLPRPKVESSLVRIERRPVPAVSPDVVSYQRFTTVVQAGFAHRRKMLRGSLAGVVDAGAFEGTGVRPDARAEDLGVDEWGRLAAWPIGSQH